MIKRVVHRFIREYHHFGTEFLLVVLFVSLLQLLLVNVWKFPVYNIAPRTGAKGRMLLSWCLSAWRGTLYFVAVVSLPLTPHRVLLLVGVPAHGSLQALVLFSQISSLVSGS
jgi:hypothetical protein